MSHDSHLLPKSVVSHNSVTKACSLILTLLGREPECMNSAHRQDGISPLIANVPSTLRWMEGPVSTAGGCSLTATELFLATDPKLPFL